MINFRGSRIAMVCAIAALASTQASAATRAPSSKTYNIPSANAGSNASASAQGKTNPGRETAGPKNGFPQNHGLDVAQEHANEHAPFKSNGV